MPKELPKGWVKTKLGEICLPVATIQPKNFPNAEFTYFDIGGIDNERNLIAETKTVTGRNAPSRARQAVRKGDILFSTVRTYLKKIARVKFDYPNAVASTGFLVIRPAEGVSSQFLFFQILSEDFLQPVHALQTGSSYPAVSKRDVFDQPILLAPLPEQKRIAAKLYQALTRIVNGEIATRRALQRLEGYRAAVLKAAVAGELTRDWRQSQRESKNVNAGNGRALLENFLTIRRNRWENAELARLRKKGEDPKDGSWKSRYPEPVKVDTSDLPGLPREWSWASLDMIAEIFSGITVSKNRSLRDPVELPYLRVANVLRGYLDLTDVKTIFVEKERVAEYLLETGDILFTEGGDRDKLGRGWVWEGQIPNCVHQNHVLRARLIDQTLLNPRIVSYWGNSFGQDFFFKHGKQTTNLASINRTVLSKLPVPVPPVGEQFEIICEVERRLSAANRMSEKLEQQLSRAAAMRQSLLTEAFAGHLVPQDPQDDPASILLERIRAAREAKLQKMKDRPMPRTKPKLKAARRPLLAVLKENGGQMAPEELFLASGHTQESVDDFFAELRQLTDSPAKIAEERGARGRIILKVLL
jgi:type I restriction enzyme, S subunit